MSWFKNTPFSINPDADNRLDARHKMIVDANREQIEGKRILDLGSHDGRWSWAALNAGAAHVTGVEGRQSLVDTAERKFLDVGVESDRFDFVCDDAAAYLSMAGSEGREFDTILCLGLFYHIMDHYRFIQLMVKLRPNVIILDTGLVDTDKCIINLIFEKSESNLNAIPEREDHSDVVVGYPSRTALNSMVRSVGWKTQYLDWKSSDFPDKRQINDYFNAGEGKHRRYTAVLLPRTEEDP